MEITVMIEAVLLDIDGTLIDNNVLHVLAWQRALRRVGRHVDATTILHKVGMGSDKLPAAILGPDDRAAAEKAREFHGEEYTDKGLIDHAEPLPGAAALLRALKDRGIRTALASSAKLEEVEKSLAQLGGPGAVDVVVSSADVSTTKPDPDVFDTALEKLGRPSRALVIGDTVYDVDAARKAGLPCVCVLSGGIEREVLAKAGAAAIYVDAADVVAHLDAILAPPAPS
jgi:HAD superfamily hydrolase (TIGR01509 family)